MGSANKKVIASQVKQVVQDLVAGLKSFDWKGFIESVKSMAHGFGTFIDMVGGAKNALILLAVVMNANAIMATFSMIGALGRLAMFLGGVGLQAIFASAELLAFAVNSAAVATGLTATLLSVAKSSALLAAAAGLGYAIGTAIYDHFISGTKLSDWIGDMIAHVLAFFGNEEAKAAIQQNATSSTSGSGAWAPVAAGGPRVGGAIDINFVNAPAGMRVQQTSSKGPIDLNANVGYRADSMGMPS